MYKTKTNEVNKNVIQGREIYMAILLATRKIN